MKLNDEQVAGLWDTYMGAVRETPDIVEDMSFDELVFEIEVDLGIEIERDNLKWTPQAVNRTI